MRINADLHKKLSESQQTHFEYVNKLQQNHFHQLETMQNHIISLSNHESSPAASTIGISTEMKNFFNGLVTKINTDNTKKDIQRHTFPKLNKIDEFDNWYDRVLSILSLEE